MSQELNLTVKCSNADKAEVKISRSATVVELKEKINEALSVPVPQQRLIYRGRVLKDESTLEFYDVQDGHTVHMVKGVTPAGSSPPAPAGATSAPVRSAPAPNSTSTSNTSNTFNPQASPFGSSPFGANPFGANAMQGPPDVSRMQDMLMRNPEMMQQIMSSPMMDNLMNNPDLMRDMMLNNPQMQSMLDANPQMRHILNDPAVLRQSMEMMRNPNAMREAMRSQDLAMSQLENLPGGFNALRRMYEEVQEPMMEAAAQSNMPNRTSGSNSYSPSSTANATAPTNTAMPNPWGAPSGAQTSAANPLSGGGFGGGGFGAGGGGFGAGGGGFGAGGGYGGPFGNAMGGMNPAQAAEMMQNPMMQQMMQQMLNDPAMIQQLSAMNPQLGMMLQNPQLRAMLTNPELLHQMSDPNMMRQMEAFNQAMGAGGAANPGMGMGMGGMNPMLAAMMMNPGRNQFGGAPQQNVGGLDFGTLLTSGSNLNPAQPTPTVDPATRYAAELQQLRDMGFSDDAASLQALIRTGGNVNAAVERLLGGA